MPEALPFMCFLRSIIPPSLFPFALNLFKKFLINHNEAVAELFPRGGKRNREPETFCLRKFHSEV